MSDQKPKARSKSIKVTIEHTIVQKGIDTVFTNTFEFDPNYWHLSQNRPIARRLDAAGQVEELVPSPWTYMTMHGFLKPDKDTKALAPGVTVD